ncbi:tetratricopeptide repeat protein [Thiohalomonas denitrificans]|uniref:tetratricopeptide repeat protein n=1 Tax=Thiohalomonas denitrificans TaxID=415747 RepID=UPI0026ED0B9A|nr:tetratricopeptide repeat protein [Thiohalomonas denitrificans]
MKLLFSIPLLFAASLAQAASLDAEVKHLAQAWDEVNFTFKGKEKEKALSVLAEEANALSSDWPNRAEPLIWEGIVLSSWAGAKGGLGALSLVDKARERLLEAERIDPKALKGSLYTSLGSLYYQVPGWPLGFGDDDKARRYLEQALELNPDGIDPNYFYGDFLREEGEYRDAVEVLERALRAPLRPGREMADEGRRTEIRDTLRKVRENLGR